MLGSKSSSLPSIMSSSDHQSMIPKEAIPRSKFDRSHGYKTTFNSGLLIPFYWDEVLPGDTHKVAATTLARLATPIVPIMDNFWAETFFFFVPYRLLWENWEKFNYTHKKEYVEWITDAKKDETRKHRIAKALEMIREGVGKEEKYRVK